MINLTVEMIKIKLLIVLNTVTDLIKINELFLDIQMNDN